jgi:hypothetical protein
MKKIALLSGFCAVAAGAFAQSSSVVIIPAFQNRFASIHQPVVAVHTVNRSAFETRSLGGSTYTADPAARGVVTSPTATARRTLDATTMNIPVFPGNTVLLQQQTGFGFGGPVMLPNIGVGGNAGTFIQQGGGSSLQQVDPFRTTATPTPAVNAVPNPAFNATPTPAAPVPTTPQLVPTTPQPQPTPGTTIPVQQQNPGTPVPGTAPGAPIPPPVGSGQNNNR